MCFRRNSEIAGAMTDVQRMSIKEAHDKLGHADENAIRKAAKALEIETLRGTMKACEACAVAKAKQKNVPKESHETAIASKEERRMFLDISAVKKMKVKKPMTLYNDNKGAVDPMNNWSVGGRSRHIEVRQHFLRELKEESVIVTVWCSGDTMSSDLFTKNLERPLFERHAETFCGNDEHSKSTKSSQGESVGE
jgi:hypothetical protein